MDSIIELDADELRRLQLIELEMLVEIDRICRKCGIKYTLDGGTLIGAVRHKGFIPWDDDLDVTFIHEEYEKFYEACKTELDTKRFFFQDYRTDPGYRWGYGKLRRRDTEYIKSGQQMLKQATGICIDIFDFEYLPNDEKERRRHMRKMFCIRKTLYSAMGRKNEKNAFMRAWYSLLYLIPKDYVFKIKNKICKKYNETHTKNVLCMMWPTSSVPNGYPRALFDGYIDVEFEGMDFMAAKGYETILKMHYGDYLTLPPKSERKGVMNAVKLQFVDLEYEDIKKHYELENRKMMMEESLHA